MNDSRFRPGHLIFGLVFVLIGAVGVGGGSDAGVQWIWAGLLAAAGVAGLTAVVSSLRRDADPDRPD